MIAILAIYSDEISCYATSFFIVENNKTKELNEYFGDDGFALKWRLAKQLGNLIK